MQLNKATLKRFMEKIQMITETGCWIWIGGDNGRYGKFHMAGTMQLAHRVAFRHFHGSLEKGRVVCHRCDTTFCVNPHHLFKGTQKQNIRDMVAKGRHSNRRSK